MPSQRGMRARQGLLELKILRQAAGEWNYRRMHLRLLCLALKGYRVQLRTPKVLMSAMIAFTAHYSVPAWVPMLAEPVYELPVTPICVTLPSACLAINRSHYSRDN